MAKYLMEDVADFVVVGTGAGGATAARVLSAAGHSVLMLEEGGWRTQVVTLFSSRTSPRNLAIVAVAPSS